MGSSHAQAPVSSSFTTLLLPCYRVPFFFFFPRVDRIHQIKSLAGNTPPRLRLIKKRGLKYSSSPVSRPWRYPQKTVRCSTDRKKKVLSFPLPQIFQPVLPELFSARFPSISTPMAAAEHAVTIHDERSMELPLLPPNQALEAVKDVFCGSVSHSRTSIEYALY